MDSSIQSILRDILCASISLDDGLSALQSIAYDHPDDIDLVYEIARAIEEIILRRPALASTKFIELIVRLSFDERRELPKMLMLLDTRYTTSYRRSEAELLPDVQAIPPLLDILSDLSQSMGTALEVNLRPLLPFLSDETLLTLDAICARGHKASALVAIHEVHYLTSQLLEAGLFECAEALFHRLLDISREMDLTDLEFEIALNEAAVLTELSLYEDCRNLLYPQIEVAKQTSNIERLAPLMLQLSVNETRDDTVHYLTARAIGDQAISLYQNGIEQGVFTQEDLGAAYVAIASNILSTGWREGVPEAITRYRSALDVLEVVKPQERNQYLLHFKALAGFGFAHGLLGDYDSIHTAIEYLSQAAVLISENDGSSIDGRIERSWCDATIGWLCLASESDEFWELGTDSFRRALSLRQELVKDDMTDQLALINCEVGLALSLLRNTVSISGRTLTLLREALLQLIPLLFTDHRAIVESSITVYDIMWMTHRHGVDIPERLLRLLDEVVKMLDVSQVHEGKVFVIGTKMVVPYLEQSWEDLQRVSREMIEEASQLQGVAYLLSSLSKTKMNQQRLSSGLPVALENPVSEGVRAADPLLAQYWSGQFALAQALHSFYTNKDYAILAEGFYQAAVELRKIESIDTDFSESLEFIRATALTLSAVLFKFVRALQSKYALSIHVSDEEVSNDTDLVEEFSFMMTQDWLGLIKITMAYLQMVEREDVKTHPYLNAVFANISRAFRMMDGVSLVERRILALLGHEMNRRYYLRR